MIMYDYLCEQCGVFEKLVDQEERNNPQDCPSCSAKGERKLSSPNIAIDGTDPSNSAAYDRWGRKRERMMKAERKRDLNR